jgi:hypothetical protein
MNKIDNLRLERIEKHIDMNHPGRYLAKKWFEELKHPNRPFFWILYTETNNPNLEILLDTDDISYQADDNESDMELWREIRKRTWIKYYWSSEWKRGIRVPNTQYKHRDDPSVPTETITALLFGAILASIPQEVFEWAHFHQKIRSPSYAGKYVSTTMSNNCRVESSVGALMFSYDIAQFYLRKLGPLKLEDIQLPTWATKVKLGGHGSRK